MPRLRVLTTGPGGEPSGSVVDATPEQAQELLREGRAELVRERSIERAEAAQWRRGR